MERAKTLREECKKLARERQCEEERSKPADRGWREGGEKREGRKKGSVGNKRERGAGERKTSEEAQRAEKIRYGAIETQEDIAAEERRGPRSEAEGRGGGGGGGESGGGRKRHA